MFSSLDDGVDNEANKADDDDDGTYDVDCEANTGSVSLTHAHTTLSLLLVSLPEIFLYVDFD